VISIDYDSRCQIVPKTLAEGVVNRGAPATASIATRFASHVPAIRDPDQRAIRKAAQEMADAGDSGQEPSFVNTSTAGRRPQASTLMRTCPGSGLRDLTLDDFESCSRF